MATSIFGTITAGIICYDLSYTAERTGADVKVTFTLRAWTKDSYTFGYDIVVSSLYCNNSKIVTDQEIKANGSVTSFDVTKSWTTTVSTTNNYIPGVRLVMTSKKNVAAGGSSGVYDSGSKQISVPGVSAPGNAYNLVSNTLSIKPDGDFTLNWAAADGGGLTIDRYSVDTMKYTASTGSWGSYSNSGSVSALNKTLNGRNLYSDLVPGDIIRVRIGTHTSAGWSADEGRPYIDISVYKDGKIMIKGTDGVVREINRVKIKDNSGVIRDIQKVKVKDTNGVIHNIDLYWK